MATLRKRSQCLSSANRRGRFNETSKRPRRSKRSSRRSVTPVTTRLPHAEKASFPNSGYLVRLRYDAAVRRPCRPGSTRAVDTGYRDPRLTARSILRPRQTVRTERVVAGGVFLRLNTTPIPFLSSATVSRHATPTVCFGQPRDRRNRSGENRRHRFSLLCELSRSLF